LRKIESNHNHLFIVFAINGFQNHFVERAPNHRWLKHGKKNVTIMNVLSNRADGEPGADDVGQDTEAAHAMFKKGKSKARNARQRM
jgi:hypothetical protein